MQVKTRYVLTEDGDDGSVLFLMWDGEYRLVPEVGLAMVVETKGNARIVMRQVFHKFSGLTITPLPHHEFVKMFQGGT